MAKQSSSKKKKPRVIGLDFKKVKHKVGRKLLPASNVTQIDVKSKSILLPGQSVAQEKDSLAVSSRRQTLKELLMQTSHHNDNVRREALLGIKDLLSRHPEELSLHAVTLVERLCPLMIDTDKSVQNALLLLMRTSIFASLPQVVMRPLVPIFMAYISSAMTNLSMNIRISAFRFLDVFIQSYSSLILGGYLSQTVQYYVELLGKMGVLGFGGDRVLEVLSSLLQLLSAINVRRMAQNGMNLSNTKMEQGLVENALESQDKGRWAMALHWYKSIVPQTNVTPRLECLAGQSELAESQGSWVFSLQLADALVKALLNCWAECAPFVCSGQGPDRESMECMVKICQCLFCVLLCLKPKQELGSPSDNTTQDGILKLGSSMFDGNPTEFQNWIQGHAIPSFARHLMACFYMCTQLINLPKDEELLFALKLGISEVMLESVITGGVQIESQDLERLLDFVECVLDGRMLRSLNLSSNVMEMYIKSMIGFVPGLLRYISRDSQVRLLQAFTVVFKASNPSSRVKRICLVCITDILKPVQVLSVRQGNKLVEADILGFQKQWLQALPRLLWELKHNHPLSSLAVLQVLHHLGQTAPENSTLAMEYTALQPILTPFFSFLSPTKSHQDAAQRSFGPFMKLPIECQQLAIDLLYYFERFSSAFVKAVTHCLCPELEVSLVVRCVEVLQQAFCRGLIKLSEHLSFLFTLLLGRASCQEPADNQKEQTVDFQRHTVITGLVCSCLCQVGDGRVLLELMNPFICQHLVQPSPSVALYGLIKVVAVLSGSGTAFLLPESISKSLPKYMANYIISILMMLKPRKQNESEEHLMKLLMQPCFTLFSKSNKLTKSVVYHLCTSTRERLHLAATVQALLQILQQDHVCRQLIPSEERFFLQDYTMNSVQNLEDEDLQTLFEKLSTIFTLAYGWGKEINSEMRT